MTRMLSKKNRTMLLALVGSLSVLAMATSVGARIGGISGQSQIGCTCHGATPSASVTVTVTGIPANYVPGNTYPLTVTVSGGPATPNGGFDLSVTQGTLTTTDINAQILNGEATHRSNLARTWLVLWQAPIVIAGAITFFVAGNAVNGDGTSSGDSWNTATYTTNPVLINQPPTITLTNPTGSQDWTGGTGHLITWTMSDDTTLPANLIVYLNYTSSSGSGFIAGPLVGATSRTWNVPAIDASDAKVNATVIDAGGLKGFNEALVPKIDSTAPTLQFSSPTGTAVAVDAPVVMRFSESMNKTSVNASFSTIPPASNWAFTWSQTTAPNDTVSATHDPFTASTVYTVTILAGATDASDTGNLLVAGPVPNPWTFTTTFINTPPTIVLNRPAAGVSLTGGSAHNVVWTANDAQDPIAGLKVWVNYSLTGAAPFDQQIAGLQGVSAASSPSAWTLPLVNRTTVVLNATVIDTVGAKGYNISAPFAIDSAAPTIALLTPQHTATNVPTNSNIQVAWSEPMNKTSTEVAFSLQDTATWTAVIGTISWAGNAMIFDPSAPLSSTTQYQGNLTATATDASIPGNVLGTDFHWTFTTSNAADLTPPTISAVTAIPDPQDAGHNVNVSALVQDDVSIGTVWLNLTPPGQGATNTTMALHAVSNRYFLNSTYGVLGTHNFVIWASDSSGNWISSAGQFQINDLSPPAAPLNLVVQLEGSNALKLTWTANSEPDLAGYKVYRSLQPGGPYTLLNTATLITQTTYTDSGLEGGKTYYYVVAAVDGSGNGSPHSNEASGHIESVSGPGGGLADWWWAIVIVVVLVVVVLLAVMLRRRRKIGKRPESGEEVAQSGNEEAKD